MLNRNGILSINGSANQEEWYSPLHTRTGSAGRQCWEAEPGEHSDSGPRWHSEEEQPGCSEQARGGYSGLVLPAYSGWAARAAGYRDSPGQADWDLLQDVDWDWERAADLDFLSIPPVKWEVTPDFACREGHSQELVPEHSNKARKTSKHLELNFAGFS
jgi:hypothetical protein